MLDQGSNSELPVIPAKRYFTIGEVSELCGVKPHVLRYWEQEFPNLKPVKRRGNRRYYQRHDVLMIRQIRSLLYDQGFTILGARQRLEGSQARIESTLSTQIVRQVLKVGASGYLTKDSEPEMLVAAIRKTAAGGRFIDPALAEQLVFDIDQPGAAPLHEQLSGREAQILTLLARGHSVNDIAADLMISNKTVSTHKAHLMQKMNFMNNADLVRYAILHGLVE